MLLKSQNLQLQEGLLFEVENARIISESRILHLHKIMDSAAITNNAGKIPQL